MWQVWGRRRGAYSVLVGKYEVKILLGRPKQRCENIIKMG
jgi:hypothetical protein